MPYDETHSAAGLIQSPVNVARSTQRTSGQTLVEMALIAPILVLLLFGIVELGRLFFAWVTVQHAARTGTRFAVTGRGEQEGTRLQQILKASRDACQTLPADSVEIIIRSWHGPRGRQQLRVGSAGGPCDLVEVEVRYKYQPVIPLIGTLMPKKIVMSGRDRKLNEPWVPCGT